MIIQHTRFLTFSLLLFLFSCGGGSGGEFVPSKVNNFVQKYSFVIYYYNAAFRTYRGASIDMEGGVNLYIVDSWPPNADDDSFTEADLDLIFNDRKTFLQSIAQNILTDNINLILEASNGVLSEPENICFDAGLYRYAGYSFDNKTGLYREVIVYETGDWQSINGNSAAVEIRDWLIEIALQSQLVSDFSNCTGIYEG